VSDIFGDSHYISAERFFSQWDGHHWLDVCSIESRCYSRLDPTMVHREIWSGEDAGSLAYGSLRLLTRPSTLHKKTEFAQGLRFDDISEGETGSGIPLFSTFFDVFDRVDEIPVCNGF
jgi:hypothetical protein